MEKRFLQAHREALESCALATAWLAPWRYPAFGGFRTSVLNDAMQGLVCAVGQPAIP